MNASCKSVFTKLTLSLLLCGQISTMNATIFSDLKDWFKAYGKSSDIQVPGITNHKIALSLALAFLAAELYIHNRKPSKKFKPFKLEKLRFKKGLTPTNIAKTFKRLVRDGLIGQNGKKAPKFVAEDGTKIKVDLKEQSDIEAQGLLGKLNGQIKPTYNAVKDATLIVAAISLIMRLNNLSWDDIKNLKAK